MKEIQLPLPHSMNFQRWFMSQKVWQLLPFFIQTPCISLPIHDALHQSQLYQVEDVGPSLNLQTSTLADTWRRIWKFSSVQRTIFVLTSVLDNNDTNIKTWSLPLGTFVYWWDRNIDCGILPNRIAEKVLQEHKQGYSLRKVPSGVVQHSDPCL